MTFNPLTNTPSFWVRKGFALLTLVAFLNAISIPMICGLGWCTPSDKTDCCSQCDPVADRGCHSDSDGCSKGSCPFANTGACTGLVFLHESDFEPEIAIAADLTTVETPASCPAGFTFDLIRPPSFLC